MAPEAPPPERDWRDLMLSNLPVMLGLLTVLVYIELRVPAEIFYSKFGVTPADAGFGNIDAVLQQSTRVLVIYALVGIAWALGYFVLMYPLVVTLQTRTFIGETDGRWKPLVAFLMPFSGMVLAAQGESSGPSLLILGILIIVAGLFLPRAMFTGAAEDRKKASKAAIRWSRFVAIGGFVF